MRVSRRIRIRSARGLMTLSGAAALVILILGAAPSSAQPPQKFETAAEAFQVGQRELAAEQYAAAEAAFREVLRLDPNSAAAYTNLGVVYMRTGRFDAAIASLQEAARLAPRVAGIHLNLGLAHLRQGEYREAIPPFQKALELGAEPGRTRYLLGFTYYLVNDYEAAAMILDPIYPQFSTQLEYLFVLGASHGKCGREQEAARIFDQMLQVGGDSPRIHWFLGNAYLTAQVDRKAIEELEKASADPKLPYVFYGLGLAYYRTRELDKAAAALEREISLNPQFAAAHGLRGSVCLDQRRLDEALASYQKAFELEPNLVGTHYGLGRVYMLKGENAKAIEHLQRAIALNPDNASIHFQLGQAYMKVGRKEEGKKELAHAQDLQVAEREMLERKVLGELPPSPVQPNLGNDKQ